MLQVERLFRQCRMLLRRCCRFWQQCYRFRQQCRMKFRPFDKVETNWTCSICLDFVEMTKFYDKRSALLPFVATKSNVASTKTTHEVFRTSCFYQTQESTVDNIFRCACRKNLEFLTRRYSFSWSSIVVCSSFKSCKFEWVFNWKKLDVHVLWYVRFVYFCGFYLDLYNYLYIFYMATCKRLKCPSFGHSIRVNSTVLIFVYYISFALIGLK